MLGQPCILSILNCLINAIIHKHSCKILNFVTIFLGICWVFPVSRATVYQMVAGFLSYFGWSPAYTQRKLGTRRKRTEEGIMND